MSKVVFYRPFPYRRGGTINTNNIRNRANAKQTEKEDTPSYVDRKVYQIKVRMYLALCISCRVSSSEEPRLNEFALRIRAARSSSSPQKILSAFLGTPASGWIGNLASMNSLCELGRPGLPPLPKKSFQLFWGPLLRGSRLLTIPFSVLC